MQSAQKSDLLAFGVQHLDPVYPLNIYLLSVSRLTLVLWYF
ncbi:hypothetical protein MNB_SM-7-837 [hydrothermal vent metagenome]|uniref:Uncharacterized protein n=1 Tax=hydrothermal vent metagenome TaxID=652676 RepID=A0A1W1C5R4_9ZZZZ